MNEIIIFDTETNGFNKDTSVLSISAIKIGEQNKKFELLDIYHRFYFRKPEDAPNLEAISVNGLTDEVIEEKRLSTIKSLGFEYPEYYDDDILSFKEFCCTCNKFIGHNIKFDAKFVPFILENQFDTMIENCYILQIPGMMGKYKNPKLIECIEHYKIPINKDKLHASLYDVIMTWNVFINMVKSGHKKANEFLEL